MRPGGFAGVRVVTGHFKAAAQVAESPFSQGDGDGAQSVTVAIFWLKTDGGWRALRPTRSRSAGAT